MEALQIELADLRRRNAQLESQVAKLMHRRDSGSAKSDEVEDVEVKERNNSKSLLVRSRSITLDERPGLHQRHISHGKENNIKDVEHHAIITPERRLVKAKVSDINDVHNTPKTNGHVALPDEEEGGYPDSSEIDDEDYDADESDDFIDDDSSHNKHIPRVSPASPRSSTASPTTFQPFKSQLKERAGWLIGLMFLQSCSSFIIQNNQKFLQNHMVIVGFLTMLVGAGGNAGNQASVRVIRALAVGTLNRRTMKPFLMQEAKMAGCLSALIGMTGFLRAAMFHTPPGETIAITASVCMIVAISVAIGSTLPLGMTRVGIDPAHSSTSIQVIMDIMGVFITVCVSSFVFSFKMFHKASANGTYVDGKWVSDIRLNQQSNRPC